MRKNLYLKIEKEPATRPQSEIEIFYFARLDELNLKRCFCCPFALKKNLRPHAPLTLRFPLRSGVPSQ
jgi:hypothetical protein